MTPGQLADRALRTVDRAGGELGYLVVKQKLSRRTLQSVLDALQSAVDDLKQALGD